MAVTPKSQYLHLYSEAKRLHIWTLLLTLWAMRRNSTTAQAFTLIELLVTIAILALLIGILLPSLSSAKETAKLVTCASNLRQIGIGTLAYSLSNDETYCSGPFDNRELNSYGPIDEAGWLADMVNGEYLVPGNFLCPSNPAQYTQNMTMDRLHDNRPQKSFTEEERNKLIKAGYNTNYTMSWYFGFTEMREPRNAFVGSPKKIDSVIGPLSDRFLARVSPVRVPLMADGRTDGALEDYEDFGEGPMRVAKAFGDGPVRYPSGLWGRQNYADFGPAHIRTPKTNGDDHDRSKGNILFADGHVQNFKDDDRNGGFGWDLPPGGALPSNDKYPEIEENVFGGHLSSGRFTNPGSPLRNR